MLRHIAAIGSTLPNVRLGLVLTVSALALPLASCGGSGSAGGAGTPVVLPTPTPSPTVTPSPSPSPTPSPTPSATPTATPTSWSGVAGLYDTQPNLATCNAGVLKDAVRQEFLTRVNALRALHNLAPVTLANSTAENQQVDQSSLMMAVNQALSHTPPSSWTCYTAAGYTGANTSNLIGGWGTGLGWSTEDDHLAGWMNERYSASIGHRRWILDPFLGKLSYGRVTVQGSNGFRSDAGTMKVMSFASAPPAPSSVPQYVAYPFGDYPVRYFGASDILSFSVIASSASRGANGGVSFSGATVQVSNSSGNLTVTDVASDNVGYGIPNSIQWKVTGLQANVTYTVRITGVAGAPQSTYQYTFKMVP